MKVLHTSDWHLGKRMEQNERTEEHGLFFQWLINTIKSENIDVLIVSGDVFDTGNPSNSTLKQYYNFLREIKDTPCNQAIITGGNHDSVSTLHAPKDLLEIFNIHIIGGVPDHLEDLIIPIRKEPDGITELIICAVPFLRDKDIRLSVAGESDAEREKRIREGIASYYTDLIPYIKEYKDQNIPIIATGHLFAAGSVTSPDSEKEIHVGNLGQISGNLFPTEFDYIALGHLHRPQIASRMNHIRYCGSPIALSFSENEDKKVVLVIDFEKNRPITIKEIQVPPFRRLFRIKGSLETVKTRLSGFSHTKNERLPAWIEIQVETENPIYELTEQLHEITKENPGIGQLFIRQIRIKSGQNADKEIETTVSLQDLNPQVIFEEKCRTETDEKEFEELKKTFKLALELMIQKDELTIDN